MPGTTLAYSGARQTDPSLLTYHSKGFMQMRPHVLSGVTLVCAFLGCSAERAVAPAPESASVVPFSPAEVYSGPAAGFRIAHGETTTVTISVLSKSPLRDFRFVHATGTLEKILPALCPSNPDTCFTGPSNTFPSLQVGSSFILGTFTDIQIRVAVFPCRPEQFVSSCSPTASITTLFQDTQQGIRRYGVEVVGPVDFADLVFEIRTNPRRPPIGLQLTMGLSRDTVAPVTTGGCFNAVAQTVYTTATGGGCSPGRARVNRTDVTEVTVFGVITPSGAPASGAQVTLTSQPVDTSGNHRQGHSVPRPNGAFFLEGEDVNQDGRPAGRDGQIVATLDAQGQARIRYRSSGVGGLEVLVATISTPTTSATRRDTLTVAITGLVELIETGSIDTVGVDGRHPDTHWGTALLISRLRQLGDSLQHQYDRTLRVNDMSLRWGGLLDIDGNWRQPHAEHRDGRAADLRTVAGNDQTALDPVELEYVRTRWRRLNPELTARRALLDHTIIPGDAPHFHVRVP